MNVLPELGRHCAAAEDLAPNSAKLSACTVLSEKLDMYSIKFSVALINTLPHIFY